MKYEEPEMILITLESEEVITTSILEKTDPNDPEYEL